MAELPVSIPHAGVISCVEMHTSGEPTRIVYAGHPQLTGTLLEQRAEAKAKYDHIRRRLNWEPRGHFDMYGAILRPETELTATGKAHIGVLFTTNDGYSTMCGHATIALGRLLVDSDERIFAQRSKLEYDPESQTTQVKLHAPCGLLDVTVPTLKDGRRSDPSRPVSFTSVPSFATGISVNIPIGPEYQWPELRGRHSVTADFSYGGAFFCLISLGELGFSGRLNQVDLAKTNIATKKLKAAIVANPDLQSLFQHPIEGDLSFLYGVMIVDQQLGQPSSDSDSAETGLYYFSGQQIDRSPTGSGVAARVALAYAKDPNFTTKRTYHSLVSHAMTTKSNNGGFIGTVVQKVEADHPFPVVLVEVKGSAYYTGFSQYVVEDSDPLGDDGFIFEKLSAPLTS
ncbi:uncharacterized protein HMPREF1541_10401 [Cyphellophora europaea CBS 101466]|uniref:trans-L-3-hydroxyproline dehydratase n=1 Tax=Cyphellophora europaea (strain CBS 101466) TaxID=1220924 RepID=W2S7P5_CYPE1|nr:uncharacterized protein HMPREF1541_10401 [Cyphellophora europaea CBS 101466]ETN44731.1 hypothetical protein HMPREF1541_10401 [Cyphellophora europaea CBS 101466]